MTQTAFSEKGVYEQHSSPEAAQQPLLVELTPKKYKIWMLRGRGVKAIGQLIAFFSVIGSFFAMTKIPPMAALGIMIMGLFCGGVLMCIGVVIEAIAQQQAWWNHG